MKIFRTFAFSAVVAATLGAGPCNTSKPVDLTIFHTNDIHSHVMPPKSDEFGLGGLAKLATLLGRLRATNPVSITVDAGDWSEGSWLYNLDTGKNMLKMFDAMKFDATCIGNHDYLAGPDQLLKTVAEAKVSLPVLVGNFDVSGYPRGAELLEKLPGTAIIERGGIKIGLIGITTQDYPFAPFLKPVVVTEPMAAVAERAKLLRPQVDVLIVLSHLAFKTNIQLAHETLGIDAVISGHSHVKAASAVMVPNAGRDVPVVETGEWARFLGQLKLRVDKSKKMVSFVSYQLHPVLSDLPEDPTVAAMAKQEDDRLKELYGGDIHEIIADTEIELNHSDAHQASLGDLSVKAYRESAAADLAIEAMALTGVKIPAGPVTVYDLHDVLPHILDPTTGKEWTVKVWTARAQDVGLVMNVLYGGVNLFASYNAGIVAMDGVELKWKPKQKSSEIPIVTELKIGGEPIDMGRKYTVALTDGMLLALQLANDKFHLGLELTDIRDTGVEGWRAVLAYALKVRKFTADGLREGGRSYTTTADPAVFHYGITYDATAEGLAVTVSNEGLVDLPSAKLRCSSGPVNDYVKYETEDAIYTPIAEVPVPAVAALSSTLVPMPWKPVVQGQYAVQCQVVAKPDGYAGNSKATRLVKVER